MINNMNLKEIFLINQWRKKIFVSYLWDEDQRKIFILKKEKFWIKNSLFKSFSFHIQRTKFERKIFQKKENIQLISFLFIFDK
jgi:hypothetical protein